MAKHEKNSGKSLNKRKNRWQNMEKKVAKHGEKRKKGGKIWKKEKVNLDKKKKQVAKHGKSKTQI